ncbi:MAG: hypothetical protein D6685_00205 [Bacteroidetes bacterium]|nr:hypothetical protein AWN76_008660 [Rhodothermaceae bacterium RA]RMH70309.1 MAG: hypothetical protein D6685_00205 [Bacteroidota bacterium]
MMAAVLLAAAGCTPRVKLPENPLPDTPTVPPGTSAWIYVDGREKGVTPNTIQVRRGFGETTVALVAWDETQRVYEIERYYTSNRSELDYSFGTTSIDGRVLTIDSETLERDKKGRYLVPYYASPIAIEDRHFNLTILVLQ